MSNAVVVSMLLLATLVLTCAASTLQHRDRALAYLREQSKALGVHPADLDDLIVTSQATSESSGATHVYVRQRYRGIDIAGAEITVNFARDGTVVNHAGQFFARLDRVANRPTSTLTAAQATVAAAKHAGVTLSRSERAAAPTTRVYHPVSARELRLAWQVEVKTRDEQHWWVITVDAVSGAILGKTDRVVSVKEEVA